jgi:hypothetical protein
MRGAVILKKKSNQLFNLDKSCHILKIKIFLG